MTNEENKSLNEIYKAVTDFKSDVKDLFRDIKDQFRDLKDEMRDLRKENEGLTEIITNELDDSSPETMIDKALALAQSQPELAKMAMDKFGDKLAPLLEHFVKGQS